ncbi:MAG: hypothetical protein HC793_04350 [Aquincola sp.]|nr:hypothetical protein [Aquincola sp.]
MPGGVRTAKPGYAESVFINCPFDQAYLDKLHAVLFTIHDCGFVARHALESQGGAESRLDKICRLVDESQWLIHDLSRVELAAGTNLPRFNMPFECGLAFGAVRYGAARDRDLLVLAGKPFEDKATLSDLAGIDPVYHSDDRRLIVSGVWDILRKKAEDRPMRSDEAISRRLLEFEKALPGILRKAGVSPSSFHSLRYIKDWVVFATIWMEKRPGKKLPAYAPRPDSE